MAEKKRTGKKVKLDAPETVSKHEDSRMEFLFTSIQDFFRSHTLDSFRSNAENQKKMMEFLNRENAKVLFVLEVGSNNLEVRTAAPVNKGPKQKMLFFSKCKDSSISENGIAEELILGDCSVDPVQHLEQVTQNIFIPLLSSAVNQDSWSEVIKQDISESMTSFITNIQITSGLIRGETYLPLPNAEYQVDEDETERKSEPAPSLTLSKKNTSTASAPVLPTGSLDTEVLQKELIHTFESSIVTWTQQIKNVLRMDPEEKFKEGMNPGPLTEIEFWENKATNLNSIFMQLQSSRIRKVLTFLDVSKSSYNQSFAKLCKEAFEARIEANENAKYLRTLRPWVIKLSDVTPFDQLIVVFRPMMHLVLLIWKHAEHYSTIPRLVILMREIANAVIDRCTQDFTGDNLFEMYQAEEHDQAFEKLCYILKVVGALKKEYFEYKSRVSVECPTNPWRVQNTALFSRLDSFLERCHDLLELTKMIMHFYKLEQVEIGGTKGKTLSTSVHQISSDFQVAIQSIKDVSYDVMSVDCKTFDDDFYSFRVKAKELERRMASVLTQGFDDCATVNGCFKLLESFDQVLERPLVNEELENKNLSLLMEFGKDVALVQQEFFEFQSNPRIFSNLPPIAGAVTWCRGLLDRVSGPMQKLRHLHKSILDRDGARDIIKSYTSLVASLAEYENSKVREWGETIETSSISKLKLPLLRRDHDTNQIKVNFDPALVRLLREVKYFILLELEIPESAMAIYSKCEEYRRETGNLELITQMYNRMQSSLLPVERPLVNSHLNRIDKVLSQGMKTLTWKSHGIDAFIAETTAVVNEADEILSTMKDALVTIDGMMEGWAETSMISRSAKTVPIDEFNEQFQKSRAPKYQLITEQGKELHKILKEILKQLKISAGLPDWKSYVDYINNIVLGGLSKTICTSVEYLSREVNTEVINSEGRGPMLEVELLLNSRMVLFSPVLEETSKKDGIKDHVGLWVEAFFHIGGLFKRIDSPNGNYNKELTSDPEVRQFIAEIYNCIDGTKVLADEVAASFKQYEYLWTTDLNKMFQEFLLTAFLPSDEGDSSDEEGEKQASGSKTEWPNLEKFDEKIKFFQELREEISELPPSYNIGYLRINSQPIKQALSTWVTKWIYTFTQYLHENVTKNLQSMDDFVCQVTTGLSFDVNGVTFDDAALRQVVQHVQGVRKKMGPTESMFTPLRETIQLLKSHGLSFDKDTIGETPILEYFENAKETWDTVVNMAFKAREQIQPKQNMMTSNIKTQVSSFWSGVTELEKDFMTKGPFADDGVLPHADAAYISLQKYSNDFQSKEEEEERLGKLEILFEIESFTKNLQLQEMSNKIKLLKTTWDVHSMVMDQYHSWKDMNWEKIDAEYLEVEISEIAKTIKKVCPRSVYEWGVYKDLNNRMENIGATVPLIRDLRHPAMKDRHWKTLMTETNCHFERLPTFELEKIFEMNLHMHLQPVQDLIELAQKEQKIDEKLRSIEDAWVSLELTYVPHGPVMVLSSPDTIIEILEENQLQLQSLAGLGKFVDFFREKVVRWQKSLGHVESTLAMWLQVQRSWESLENIFLSGADIRQQLPEHTKIFEGLDKEFRAMMEEANSTPNVLYACTVEGRLELLQGMWKSLEVCQKALNEYLDQKKNIFPRFFFVSNTALLDILSNGDLPEKVMPYISACFSGISSLELIDSEVQPKKGSIVAKTAISMISPENEKVTFPKPFPISGAVENWLNGVTDMMQSTLKYTSSTALKATNNWGTEGGREAWLFEYPAQVILLASQVVWTDEVRLALEETEGGNETALGKCLTTLNTRLEGLIRLVQGELSKEDRVKIICLITIDVHGKEVVENMVKNRVEKQDDFAWQSQLRFQWNDEAETCEIKITDFVTKYSFEYIGNVDRLVITPLTDRCYITLTMALRLNLGGAPAGPAGTGKTETTKDLSRALGLACYVFNCSDQMNYQTIGDIFKGLTQSGTWGCFDEFNRIPIEVLSVVASQVKLVLDAVRHFSEPSNRKSPYDQLPAGKPPGKVGEFDFMGTVISLVPTTGFFITMNPGYAGRSELPENLKANFRSCAMIRPDLQPICQNMLMAEGFIKALPLSIKFVTLYELSSELLSPQVHYDWGLRNVKSVLRVAGMLKRAQPDVDETPILMRALRDFNVPKLPFFDLPIFLNLIRDIFPGITIDPENDPDLRARVVKACIQRRITFDGKPDPKYTPPDLFVSKTCNFQELIDVRHSVMLLGPPGCGKSTVWKTLADSCNVDLPKPTCVTKVVNPKSITSNELYGYMTLQRDWKDGCLSMIMRNMSERVAPYHATQQHHWVVLDGDIDAIWIESMNTVMDDNKVLTLVSNERIPLTPQMRLIFEIHSLENATPATVSRAGILYINEKDIGWGPYLDHWLAKIPFSNYVKEYFEVLLNEFMHVGLEEALALPHVVPRQSIAMVEAVCRILEATMDPKVKYDVSHKSLLDHKFSFAMIWGLGGSLENEKIKQVFSSKWSSIFKAVEYPTCDVFACFYDHGAGIMKSWNEKVEVFIPGDNVSFSKLIVPTIDSVCFTFFLESLCAKRNPVCLVGSSGTGKTTVIQEFLSANRDKMVNTRINMNYYTDSAALQVQLEQPIDKRSGKIFGPIGDKPLCYFVDDLNMPFVEEYGTQPPIELIRQYIDYARWYDRVDLGLEKVIQDTQVIAAMNHKCGSFTINPRLQRHFAVLTCEIPGQEALRQIYGSILGSHLDSFQEGVRGLLDKAVNSMLELHSVVSQKFMPSASKFHYVFNLRDISAVMQGLLRASSQVYKTPLSFVRLLLHESTRVIADRFINEQDVNAFEFLLEGVAKKYFDEDIDKMLEKPLIFTNFVKAGGQKSDEEGMNYTCVPSLEILKKTLDHSLVQYNQSKAKMDLVLFNLAAEQVCRITRILSNPGGNALLVGVGGSGKQSLSKLAVFICGYELVTLRVTGDFSINDFKESIKVMYKKAGVKSSNPLVFLLNDSQIIDERFLVYVNDLLSSGFIPDLFAPDEYDGIFSSIRNEAKADGIPNTREHLMEYLVGRVRSALHIVVCHSPVGDMFRNRARKFPALVNCSSIDWFHPWPREALVSVAGSFLKELDLGTEDVSENVIHHFAEVHLSVTDLSVKYRELHKRYNYVTPKSFLEFIAFYKGLLKKKRAAKLAGIERLSGGLTILRKTAEDVGQLQDNLKVTMVKVEERKVATDALLEEMGTQKGEAQIQQDIASAERAKAEKFAREAAEIEADASVELAQAQPAMDQASEAVNCLTKAALTELKSLSKPPAGVDKVTTCVLIMVKGEKKNFSWDNAKKMMAAIDRFKTSLEEYDAKNIPQEIVDRVSTIIEDPDFTYESYMKKSSAAANMANWVINIIAFNRIFKKIKPLMERLENARESKESAMKDLAVVEAQLAEVEAKLNALQERFMQATQDKAAVEAEAKMCTDRLNLAERLVNGLSSENERWASEIEQMNHQMKCMVGDTLLASAFVSYVGAFPEQLRATLTSDLWTSDIAAREIPLTPGIMPLQVLTDDAEIATWGMEGLPVDPFSTENGVLITASSRWPLIIDPQMQALTWLKQRLAVSKGKHSLGEDNLVVMQTSQKGWLHTLTKAISSGQSVIIENVTEKIDSTLDPLLSQSFYFKGKQPYLDIGGQEVEYDSNFKLYLQSSMSNPHFKPEQLAQCTLINFIVTESGLEEQLLSRVVGFERAELEQRKQELQTAFNQYKIQLHELENDLLEKLANAPVDILSDVQLIESLEATKATATEVAIAVEKGKETEQGINEAREGYRLVATEAAMLYFMMIQLSSVNPMYQYSLKSFIYFFEKAMKIAPAVEDGIVSARVQSLVSTLRMTIFQIVSRGLFESHKTVFLTQLAFNLLRKGIIPLQDSEDVFSPEALNFLLQAPRSFSRDNEIEWLPDPNWEHVCALAEIAGFENLPSDMIETSGRFQEWFNHAAPEKEKLPGDWRELENKPFLKLLVVRALRPDRTLSALDDFVCHTLPNGTAFAECDSQLNSYQILDELYHDSSPLVPIYFILSPGSDVGSDLDRLAKVYNKEPGVSFINISLGQGQDVVAIDKLEKGNKKGWWVCLNNIHLMTSWLETLTKKLDAFAREGESHADFRVFLTSDPSDGVPVSLLDRCITLTNELPTGLRANLKRSWAQFPSDEVESMDNKARSILFGLCYFHSVMIERKKYGSKGFNMLYPFSGQDLTACAIVLKNYLDTLSGTKLPWEDLRYLFGEIMYGGHIVNDIDRTICNTYLNYYMNDGILDEMEMFPFQTPEASEAGKSKNSFRCTSLNSHEKYIELIDNTLPDETPLAYGLHPNAELGFRTSQNNYVFEILNSFQPAQAADDGDHAASGNHFAEAILQDIMETYKEVNFDLNLLTSSIEDPNPFQNMYLQECKRMQSLIDEMLRSLSELELGFKGELSMNAKMEALANSLCTDAVPKSWVAMSYPTRRPLGSWLTDLQNRINQLQTWTMNPDGNARFTWISGFFNPNAFLTAILQMYARATSTELDKLVVTTEILKKKETDIDQPSSNGSYISGLSIEGARWDFDNVCIVDSLPKELYAPMPIVNCKATEKDDKENPGIYTCPVYRTQQRGPTFIFFAQLKTKVAAAKWVLAGVALLMDPA